MIIKLFSFVGCKKLSFIGAKLHRCALVNANFFCTDLMIVIMNFCQVRQKQYKQYLHPSTL